MLAQEVSIPVYFARWTPQLSVIVEEVTRTSISSDKTKSAAEAMFSSISGNGYQIVISPGSPNVRHDVKIATIQGYLAGKGGDGKNPTIAVVAHYDSFGIAPVGDFYFYFIKELSKLGIFF